MVQVEHQDGERPRGAAGERELLGEQLVEEPTVVDARQPVAQRAVASEGEEPDGAQRRRGDAHIGLGEANPFRSEIPRSPRLQVDEPDHLAGGDHRQAEIGTFLRYAELAFASGRRGRLGDRHRDARTNAPAARRVLEDGEAGDRESGPVVAGPRHVEAFASGFAQEDV